MKVFIILAVLLAVAAAIVIPEEEIQKQFKDFTVKYNKVYASTDETKLRYANFKRAVNRIAAKNLQNGATFGINKFSDLSPAEFRANVLMTPREFPVHEATAIASVQAAPASFDWRDKGAVTPVKDQEQCGSCWAFSATEAIESAWILKGHATASSISLAPQQIVDCDTIDGVEGCNGGETESAYQYIMQVGGQEPSSDYPYTGEDGTCKFKAADVVAKISNYQTIPKDESTLPATLASTGPLSICLDASHWQDYQSGVLTNFQCCPLLKCQMDHCVQLVGYNTTASTPYWIVRNSWNTDWGVNGYIYLEMNKNTCGMTNDITWPTSE